MKTFPPPSLNMVSKT